MIAYHSTPATLGHITEGLCLATDADASATYLDGQSGHRYTVELPGLHQLQWANEDELADAARACGYTEDDWMDWGGIFWAADQDDVRAHLTADGYQLVEYVDQEQTSGDTHQTYRVLDPSIVTVISHEHLA